MAWADLQPNQMVDENNASTGGFTTIGAKVSPPNKCYTKSEALTAYNLNSGAMIEFANNQLVPKSAWVSGTSYIYTGNLTVGNYASDLWGYYPTLMGSLDHNDLVISGRASIIFALYYNAAGSNLTLEIDNNSSSEVPNGWTTLTIGGISYNRASMSSPFHDGNTWFFELSPTSNPFGTTVGIIKTVTIN